MAKPTITGHELQGRAPGKTGTVETRGANQRGPGRPPLLIPRSRVLQIRVTEEDYETIRRAAFERRQAMSDLALEWMQRGGMAKMQERNNAEMKAVGK